MHLETAMGQCEPRIIYIESLGDSALLLKCESSIFIELELTLVPWLSSAQVPSEDSLVW